MFFLLLLILDQKSFFFRIEILVGRIKYLKFLSKLFLSSMVLNLFIYLFFCVCRISGKHTKRDGALLNGDTFAPKKNHYFLGTIENSSFKLMIIKKIAIFFIKNGEFF